MPGHVARKITSLLNRAAAPPVPRARALLARDGLPMAKAATRITNVCKARFFITKSFRSLRSGRRTDTSLQACAVTAWHRTWGPLNCITCLILLPIEPLWVISVQQNEQ